MRKPVILFLSIFLVSCAGTKYYQVYKAIPDNGTTINDKIVFEDKNCSVAYDLWAEKGNSGFNIYNKNESDLTIDLTKSFFVLNGVAHPYFQNRTLSQTFNSGSTFTSLYPYLSFAQVSGTTTGQSTSYVELPQIIIPPTTMVNVSEYQISDSRYKDCDLIVNPSSKQIKTLKFDKSDSPFVFYNIISYNIKGESARIENKFYISEITNYPSTEMYTKRDTSSCGKKKSYGYVFKKGTPDKFYLKYDFSYSLLFSY